MLRLLRVFLLSLLTGLLVMSAGTRAQALFQCLSMQTVSEHCCCKATPSEQTPCDKLDKKSCCTKQSLPASTPPPAYAQLSFSVPASAVLVTRVPLADLLLPQLPAPSFTLREAPRAIGPPILLRTLQLLI